MNTLFVLGAIAVSIFLGAATAWVAKETGNNPWVWLMLSILLPVVALCILLCLPEETKRSKAIKRQIVKSDNDYTVPAGNFSNQSLNYK
ncbi:MAG TPA: hypothetical protein VF476_01325 [Chitinophagaceae bacterium]